MPITKTLNEISGLLGGRLMGDGSIMITDVAALRDAAPGQISFVADAKSEKLLDFTKASAVVVGDERLVRQGTGFIVVKNTQLALAKLLDLFRPADRPVPGVDPMAVVDKTAVVHEGASVMACAVVEAGASVGRRAIVYPGAYIGRNSVIGDDSVLYPGVSVREDCRIGSRVIIHSNSVIGSDGFGYARQGAAYIKIPQRGTVEIGDDVEIGACVTVDRATLGSTSIGRGTKIDNLVQIAHNVKVGEDTVIVAQVGIAGSATIGSRVQLAGQAGVNGHIEIVDDVMIGAKAGVVSPISGKGAYSGMPAMAHGEWLRAQAIFSKLPELKKKISELEKRITELENTGNGQGG